MIKFSTLIIFLAFQSLTYSQDILLLKTDGKVVIGDTTQITTPGNYNLYVQNGILTESVKVSLKNSMEWSDDAWDKRPTLNQMDESITLNKHLIDMPSADELVMSGYELKDMDAKQLAQIEWLWTYVIEMDKKTKLLEEKVKEMEEKLNAIGNAVNTKL